MDGAGAVRQARRLEPDVVLMDVRMPVIEGLQPETTTVVSAPGRRFLPVCIQNVTRKRFLDRRQGMRA